MRRNSRVGLLGGAGADLGRVDARRAVLVEHDLAVDLDLHAGARRSCTRGATDPSARTTT